MLVRYTRQMLKTTKASGQCIIILNLEKMTLSTIVVRGRRSMKTEDIKDVKNNAKLIWTLWNDMAISTYRLNGDLLLFLPDLHSC